MMKSFLFVFEAITIASCFTNETENIQTMGKVEMVKDIMSIKRTIHKIKKK